LWQHRIRYHICQKRTVIQSFMYPLSRNSKWKSHKHFLCFWSLLYAQNTYFYFDYMNNSVTCVFIIYMWFIYWCCLFPKLLSIKWLGEQWMNWKRMWKELCPNLKATVTCSYWRKHTLCTHVNWSQPQFKHSTSWIQVSSVTTWSNCSVWGIYTGVPGGMDKTSGECSYVKIHRYNPKHLYPKLNGYRDNGQRSLKLWQLLLTYW